MTTKISLEAELWDAYEGEGNSKRRTFLQWCRDMAGNPRGVFQDSAQAFLAARRKAMKRHAGHCWSCATDAKVRQRTFWTTGLIKPLCADCERQLEKGLCKLAYEVSP